ncbi:MAG TPA: hypothetical protein VI997_09555, partial [Candidatus Thermoplasmatota archaeon]|nr:hypothetical protein [Candidatus Thermoplasmatota archaeon]
TSEALRKLLQVSAQKLPGMPPGEERDTKFGYGELDVQCLLSEGVGSPACAQPAPPATCAPVDAFGYRCFASGALSRPPDALYLDDPGEGEVDLGFALDFYGLKFSRAFVSPAGLVTFGGSCSAPCKPASFPHPTGPNGFVAAGWSEDPAGKVLLSRHPTTGDVFLEWFDKPADLAPRAVLAIRNGSGDLEVDAAGVADGLVGIEDPSGSTGVRAPTARVVLASPGTAPPGPPEGLVAAPRAGVTTWIDVAWDVPASGAYGVQRYEVWRSTEPDEDGVLLGLTQATRFADDVDRSCEGCATRGRTDSFHYSVRAIGPGGHGSFARTCSGLVPFAACLDLSDVVQTDGGLP